MARLKKGDRDDVLAATWAVVRMECKENIENFAKYVVTKDEHAEGAASVRLFPTREEKPYIWNIIDTIHREQLLAVEKSRQLMVTWIACLYALWMAKYQENRLIFLQSKKEDDAANLVFNQEWPAARISFMEYHLPPELQSDCATSYSKLRIRDTNSLLWGIPEGGDQIRSYVASFIFSDESAFQPEFAGAWKAANPSIKGGGKMLIVSTARSGAYMKQLISRV